MRELIDVLFYWFMFLDLLSIYKVWGIFFCEFQVILVVSLFIVCSVKLYNVV